MQAYVFPFLAKRPVAEIAAAEVIDIRKPIWNTKRETSFKDWCAEVSNMRDEVSVAALVHRIPNKVRAAYLRTFFWKSEND
jgi:hypothetical protein